MGLPRPRRICSAGFVSGSILTHSFDIMLTSSSVVAHAAGQISEEELYEHVRYLTAVWL